MRIGCTIDGRPAQTLPEYDPCIKAGGVAAFEESEEEVCRAVKEVQGYRPVDGEDLPGPDKHAEEQQAKRHLQRCRCPDVQADGRQGYLASLVSFNRTETRGRSIR